MLKCLLLIDLFFYVVFFLFSPLFSWLIRSGLSLYPGLLWLDPSSLGGLSAVTAGGRGAELCSQGNVWGNKAH